MLRGDVRDSALNEADLVKHLCVKLVELNRMQLSSCNSLDVATIAIDGESSIFERNDDANLTKPDSKSHVKKAVAETIVPRMTNIVEVAYKNRVGRFVRKFMPSADALKKKVKLRKR